MTPSAKNSNSNKGKLPNHWKIILVLAAVILGYGLVFMGTAKAQALKIACYKDYRPYSYVDDKGEVVGMLVDFWNLWAEKNHMTLTYLPGQISQSLERVRTGKADIMIGLFKSGERSQYLAFSNPIMDISTNLYVRQDMDAESIAELGNTPVGVIEADYVVSFLAKTHPKVEVKTFPDSETIVKNAMAGKLDAYALDFPNAVFLLAEHGSMTKFRILSPLYKEKLRAGVAKGNTELLKQINQGLKQTTNKEIQTLHNKWGLLPAPLILQYKSWIAAALVILLIGLAGFGYYIFRLKSRIRRIKTKGRPFKEAVWLGLIAEGENESVEFKSSLRWNLATEKTDKILEFVVIKTLSAFMNTKGGTLMIGVDDQGALLGLEADYLTFQKKPDRDGFLLKLSSLISRDLGRHSHKFIAMDIRQIQGKDICMINVKPGEKPVFIKEKGKESFYIRAGAASVPMSMSESHEYISSRF